LPPALVGTAGFEPATSSSRTMRATKLRYVPRNQDCSRGLGLQAPGGLSELLYTNSVDAVAVHPHYHETETVDGQLVAVCGDVAGRCQV
jgi:hypothetical protein